MIKLRDPAQVRMQVGIAVRSLRRWIAGGGVACAALLAGCQVPVRHANWEHYEGPGAEALLTLTTLEHLHYGSNYPFTPEFAVAASRERLASVGDPPGSLLAALRANTERLFPELGDA